MIRVATACQKGGSGKSTSAALLALVLSAAGKKVGVYDGDSFQRTLSCALPYLILGDNVEEYQPGKDYDVVIFDTPGSMEHPAFREIIEAVDVIVIPTSPRSPDLVPAKQTVNHIRRLRPNVPLALLFCMCGPHDKPEQLDIAAGKVGAPRLKGTIPTRREYGNLLDRPLKVSPADRQTIADIALEVIQLLHSK